jgi:hypothetical protein
MQYFIKVVTYLCLFDLLKLPSFSSLDPLVLLGKHVYEGQDNLQDNHMIYRCIMNEIEICLNFIPMERIL